MKLLEISEPGFYVVKDGELTEIADYDTDQEDALRLLALKIHLDDFTSSMTIGDDHRVTVGACTKFQGVGPDEAREACDILRKALVEAMARSSQEPYPIPPTFDFTKATVFDLKTLTYPVIEHFLKKFNPESLKTGLHTVLNTLYFLTTASTLTPRTSSTRSRTSGRAPALACRTSLLPSSASWGPRRNHGTTGSPFDAPTRSTRTRTRICSRHTSWIGSWTTGATSTALAWTWKKVLN